MLCIREPLEGQGPGAPWDRGVGSRFSYGFVTTEDSGGVGEYQNDGGVLKPSLRGKRQPPSSSGSEWRAPVGCGLAIVLI